MEFAGTTTPDLNCLAVWYAKYKLSNARACSGGHVNNTMLSMNYVKT
jgi:hypothetical protein